MVDHKLLVEFPLLPANYKQKLVLVVMKQDNNNDVDSKLEFTDMSSNGRSSTIGGIILVSSLVVRESNLRYLREINVRRR